MAEVKTKINSKFLACIEANRLKSLAEDKHFIAVYASSTAKIYPYQIAAARYALRSDYSKGCILCDEASLGKTYEALLVACQMWFQGKENILVILPPNLVKQWIKKLEKDFTVPFVFWNNTKELPEEEGIIITTYGCAVNRANSIKEKSWDLVIFDEADALQDHTTKTFQVLKDAVGEAYKLLLTPTPITTSIMDIYNMLYFIDASILPDSNEFYKRYFRKPENYHELAQWLSQYCFRTLKCQTTKYVNFSRRIPYVVNYSLSKEEKHLYNLLNTYLALPNKIAFPEIDNYYLMIQLFNSVSSSAFALANMLKKSLSRAYGDEKKLLQHIRELALNITNDSKSKVLVKTLKIVFKYFKTKKVKQKVMIYINNTITQEHLNKVLTENGYNVLVAKDYDSVEQFRENEEIQILITTNAFAKGLDIEFCPCVANYDLSFDATEDEQKVSRCDRAGQKSDVLVLNFLCPENPSDVRKLELNNKRTLQFNGILGMSEEIVGNFDSNLNDVLSENFRHIDDVAKSFEENFTENRYDNQELVKNAGKILCTTFSKSIESNVIVAPNYIEDKANEINNDLWELVSYYFTEIKPHWYEIDNENKSLQLIENYNRPFLFQYNDNGRKRTYKGYKNYKMSRNAQNSKNIISFTSLFAK